MLLGIDIGTSGAKAALIHPETGLVRQHQENYDVQTPHPGWAEQDPNMLAQKAADAIKETIKQDEEITGAAFSGQMHGIVLIDKHGKPVRNAIIWADSRSGPEIAEAMAKIGEDYFRSRTLNRLAAGFGLASLLWLKKTRTRKP